MMPNTMFIEDSNAEEKHSSAEQDDRFEDEESSIKVSLCREGDGKLGLGLWGGTFKEWETDDSIDDWEQNSMCVSSVSKSTWSSWEEICDTWSSWEEICDTWSETEACPEPLHVRKTFGRPCLKISTQSSSVRHHSNRLLPSQIKCYYSYADKTSNTMPYALDLHMSDLCPDHWPESLRVRKHMSDLRPDYWLESKHVSDNCPHHWPESLPLRTRGGHSFRLTRPPRVRLIRQHSCPLASQMHYDSSPYLLGNRPRHHPNSSIYSPLMPPPIVGFSPDLPRSNTIFQPRKTNPIANEIKYICSCINPIPAKPKNKPHLQRASGKLT